MDRLAPCPGPACEAGAMPPGRSLNVLLRSEAVDEPDEGAPLHALDGGRMLDGKNGLILGVANKRSLAWAIARSCAARGAKLCLTYQGPRFEDGARELASTLPDSAETFVLPC